MTLFQKYPLLLPHIQHSIKTGLACLLSYGASYPVDPRVATWAVVSTIIAMQGLSVAESLQAGLHRLSGMGLGAVCGVILFILTPQNPFGLGAVIFGVTAVGAYITRYGSRYMLVSIGTCMLILAGSSMLKDGNYRSAISFGLLLVAEIGIGVGAAFVVSVLLWPVRLIDTLNNDLKRQFRYCSAIFSRLVDSFLDGQKQLSPSTLVAIGLKANSNRERLSKIAHNEGFIYKYNPNVLEIQILVIDRTIDAMRHLLDALNEYDEEEHQFAVAEELRALADVIVRALRHFGGDAPKEPRPDLVRELSSAADAMEASLNATRESMVNVLPLHRLLQLFTYYQTMRQLTEELLLALDHLHSLGPNREHREKIFALRSRGKKKISTP